MVLYITLRLFCFTGGIVHNSEVVPFFQVILYITLRLFCFSGGILLNSEVVLFLGGIAGIVIGKKIEFTY